MKKFIITLLSVTLLFISHTCFGQIHFSKNANVYNISNNAKVGQQYIAANITNGTGTMTIGNRTMKATVTNTKRDNFYMMTAYSVELSTPDKKYLDVVITKRDKGTYSIVVYFADGTLRYDFSSYN